VVNKKKVSMVLIVIFLIASNVSVLATEQPHAFNGSKNINTPIVLDIPISNDGTSIEYKEGIEEVTGPSSFAVDGTTIYILDPNSKLIYVCEDDKIINKINIGFTVDAKDIRIINNKIWILDYTSSIITVMNKDGNIYNQKTMVLDSTNKPFYIDQLDSDVILYTSDGENQRIDTGLSNKVTIDSNKMIKFETRKIGKVDFNGRRPDIEVDFNEIGGSINVIHEDKDATYVAVEELLDTQLVIVENTIRKYDKSGILLGTAAIPVDSYYAYPNRFYDVSSDGTVYAMVLLKDKIQIRALDITNNFKSQLPEKKQKLSASMAENTRKTHGIAKLPTYTRSQLETRALNIINYSWTCTSRNRKTMTGIKIPYFIQGLTLPCKTTGIPYNWGGFNALDTPSTFATGISAGKNAGNILCTGSVKTGTTGLDCSGFVCAVYKFSSKLGTSGLATSAEFRNIATSKLKYMDILVKSGSHVVIFKSDNFGLNIVTYESTLSGVEKAKIYNRSWSELSGYVPRTHF